MKALYKIFFRVWKGLALPLLVGTILSVIVLSAGVALLGLSGWFITAAGAAGLAGVGIAFETFRASAGVRLFAFGRAAARYGERLTTHDATLRGLASLRVKVLDAMLRQPLLKLSRLRGSERLNHLTIDVDALDGLALRLVIPAFAALAVFTAVFVILGWLVGYVIAGWEVGGFAVGIAIIFTISSQMTGRASRMSQRAMQALRMRLIDLMRGQSELAASGRLEDWRQSVGAAQDRLQAAQSELDMVDRLGGFAISTIATLVSGGALVLGALAAEDRAFDAAHAALGFFAALALFETVGPLWRGAGEIGKMIDAARRLNSQFEVQPARPPHPRFPRQICPSTSLLRFDKVGFVRGERLLFQAVSFSLKAGDILAITGASGSGKTTLLNIARGIEVAAQGDVKIHGQSIATLSDDALSDYVGYLPQRTAMVAGTIAENLRLGAPDATDEALQLALKIAVLDEVVAAKGGLDFRLGEAGRGLSGGEMRRLALARMILRQPKILLLDEPTEGLDRKTAHLMLKRLRRACPQAAILIAAHHEDEWRWANMSVTLQNSNLLILDLVDLRQYAGIDHHL
jgi:ATP-binding cassette, subfamily C, bacterial CydC